MYCQVTQSPRSKIEAVPLKIQLKPTINGEVTHDRGCRRGEQEIPPETNDDIHLCFCSNLGLSDDRECMWLSSGSPISFVGSDDLQSMDVLELGFSAAMRIELRNSSDDGGGLSRMLRCDSLLDLEKEEPGWGGDGSDALDPDFPSPSYHVSRNLRIRTSKLTLCPSSKMLLDAQAASGSPRLFFDLSPKNLFNTGTSPKKSDADEPLFWPFEWKSYWRPEFEGNFLGISPRSAVLIRRPKGRHAHKSFKVGVHDKKGPSTHKGKHLISPSSVRPALAYRGGRGPKEELQASHGGSAPSMFNRTSASCTEKPASNPSTKRGAGRDRRRSDSGRKKRGREEKSSLVPYLLEFEAGDFQVYLGGEIPIEALVGLDEFDGSEGGAKMMRAC